MACEQFRLFPRRFGFYPYIWLIYLVFPILNLKGYSGYKLLAGYVLVGLFVVTYRQLYWSEGKTYSAWLGLQMLLIAVLCIVYSPYNLYMGFFASNFIGWYTELRRFKQAFIVFTVMIIGLALLSLAKMYGTEGIFLFPFVLMMLISPFGIRSMNRRRMLEKELDQANEVIKEMVKREERMRIARDLHDTMGHTLSLITLKSQLVEKLAVKNPERAQAEAREIQRTSRAALRQVRELVSEMRAVSVAEELAEAGEMLRSAEIRLEVDGDAALPGVSDLTQNILSLCIKEAITNIVKHSGANLCRIGIGMTAGEVRITVEDNGVGAGLQDRGAEGAAQRRDGNGMKGMAERLALIDGSLTLGPGTGSGIGSGTGTGTGAGTLLTVVTPRVVKDRKDGETA
ncbi:MULTISPECIES: sensor histidine kinase [unclassified Paenibacillus]|jgi:two-component system, NarL family, sensor histidine kinase DesK|uniref:sensor histidine kinase n=1 Tax=unclassified Paenibacillus TaxID=185978 RepID=UPI00096F3059|nr:sensor histidine kinase [Paenibacillus sp. FSL P4-0081]OMF29690.1 two-component sensor histidine kinase [Paenibacillus sp. FSL H8-0259]